MNIGTQNSDVVPATLDQNAHWERGACALADAQFILHQLNADLKTAGYAGSTEICQLIFLALYTRFLERPASLAVQGPSSSGKSFALQSALRYVPTSAYVMFSGMSDKALLHASHLDLQHKYLVIAEAAGLAKGVGRAFLRQLVSEGTLSYLTVQQENSGSHKGQKLPEVKGPTGLIMTTTAASLHPEDATRMLAVHMDQSQERMRAILRGKAANSGRPPTSERLAQWHALHDYVAAGRHSVIVPYLEALADKMPITDHRVFRDFEQVQSLIKAHALMHQYTRPHEGRDGREIVATLDDYSEVYRLVEKPLAHGLQESVPLHLQEVVTAVETLCRENSRSEIPDCPAGGVSQHEVARYLERNPSVISRNIRTAEKLGYIQNLETSGRGRQAMLVPGERALPSGTVLPTPEELRLATKDNKSTTPERTR